MRRALAALLVALFISMSAVSAASTPSERDFSFKYALKFYGAGYVDLPDELLPHNGDEDRTIVLFLRVPPQAEGSYKYHNDIIRGTTSFGVSTSSDYNENPGLIVWSVPYAAKKRPRFDLNKTDVVMTLIVSWDYDESAEKTVVSAYVNNKLSLNVTLSGKFDEERLWDGDFRLGGGWAGPLYGTVYALMIYDKVLSESERNMVLNAPTAPPRNGLLAWYMPDSVDIDNLVWRDLSGHNYDAKIEGAKTVDLWSEYQRAKTDEEKAIIARLLPPSTSAESILDKMRSFFARVFGHLVFWPVGITNAYLR